MKIDRCVCHQQTFTALLDVARRTAARTLPALQEQVAFGTQCTSCHPYVRRMLRTGETVFVELLAAGDTDDDLNSG